MAMIETDAKQLSAAQRRLLEAIDEELATVEAKLKKVEPFIIERDRLRATRRVLLSEKGTTSGAGSPRATLSMEEVVHVLHESETGLTAKDIAEKLGLKDTTVRSHLVRNEDTRYRRDDDGVWFLTEEYDGD